MDLPVHIAAGAFMGHLALSIEHRFPHRVTTTTQRIKPFAAAFFLGVCTHLFLDAIPHYDWLFYITIFEPLPFYWLFPQFIVAVPVLLFTLFTMHDHPKMAVISVLGGVYPDIEKFLYFDVHIPRSMTVFRWHSCYLSQWTPWEVSHKTFLVVAEIGLLFGLLAGMYWLAHRRINLTDFPKFVRSMGQWVGTDLRSFGKLFRSTNELS